jgi:excisionase family DNA binding protein
MASFNTVASGAIDETFLLTPQQVARRLQVSVAWVRDHSTRKHPRLPLVRIGGLLRFRPAEIERWIEQQSRMSASRPR